MPGRMKRTSRRRAQLLAIADRLRGTGEILAIAQAHHVERLLRGQHRAVAGARVIRMAVRDQRLLDRPRRIDVEAAESGSTGRPASGFKDVFRAHGAQICHIGAIANPGRALALFITSGDLIADRRYELARGYAADGDLAAAADLYVQAAELAPGFASAWFALGETREALGDRDGARRGV